MFKNLMNEVCKTMDNDNSVVIDSQELHMHAGYHFTGPWGPQKISSSNSNSDSNSEGVNMP